MSDEKRTKLRIIYKSGAEQIVTCTSWTVTTSTLTGAHTDISIEGCKPRAAMLGFDEIAAAWEVDDG